VQKFFATLLFMLLAWICFGVACLVRLCIKTRQARTRIAEKRNGEKGEEDEVPLPFDPPIHDFKKRLEHSFCIILALMYLRVATLLCENFQCAMQLNPILSTASNAPESESLLLSADGSTQCYLTGHAASTAFAIVLIVVYIIGFPVFCFVRLLRWFGNERTPGISGWLWRKYNCFRHDSHKSATNPAHSAAIQAVATGNKDGLKSAADDLLSRLFDRDYSDRFGFVYDGLTPEQMSFVVHMMVIQILYAVFSVFVTNFPDLQMFLFGTLTFIDCTHTGIALPWDGFKENLKIVRIAAAV
jgi:hypothetical protein